MGNELLAKVKSLIARVRSAQIPIVYVQNNGGSGDPDAYDTPGWEFHLSIAPVEGGYNSSKADSRRLSRNEFAP